MDPTLKLLTLINVSAARPGKRQRTAHLTHVDRIAKKVASASASVASESKTVASPVHSDVAPQLAPTVESSDDEDETSDQNKTVKGDSGAFDTHFASQGPHAQAVATLPENSQEVMWNTSRSTFAALSTDVVVSTPDIEGFQGKLLSGNPQVKVLEAFNNFVESKYSSATAIHKALATQVGGFGDLMHSDMDPAVRSQFREVLAMHAMSHIAKTRRRILRNNEKLAKLASVNSPSASSDLDQDIRDQGFTRPKVLILAPFRNSALEWVDLLTKFSLCSQVDNKSRFVRDYNLPEGAVDKLADPKVASKYPSDHIDTFKGNIDDSFTLAMKVTRKSLKLFSGFYDSDVIVASPLGLRLGIEKDKGDYDFLSSIEIAIVDQTEVISMQNWDHLEFVFDRLNKIPKQSRDTDFSRVRQWSLDNRAAFFRQTVLLSRYDFPALRALYNHNLHNIAGKTRTVTTVSPPEAELAAVTPGIRHVFYRFESANLLAEPDLRFQQFTGKVLSQLQKSAVSSSHTLIFVPSYFDFVRLDDYLRVQNEKRRPGEAANFSYTSISEYSKPKQITRAREAFFAGRKRFLLLTERAHFYRRFHLRGVKTIVFYQLPQNPNFFSEVIQFPFNARTRTNQQDLDGDGEDVDPNEVQTNTLYSKYDLLQLEKVVGSKQARDMVTGEKSTWKFV